MWKWTAIASGILLVILGYWAFRFSWENNLKVTDRGYFEVFIEDDYQMSDLHNTMDTVLKDLHSFKLFQRLFRFNHPRPGRYILKPPMSNCDILAKLRMGIQDPVRLIIHGVRDIYQLAGKLGHSLQMDSLEILHWLTDTAYLYRLGYTRENILCLFIPNTYEVYWNVPPEKFLQRMLLENKKFWQRQGNNHKARLKSLTPNEVYTLASIVEKETVVEEERPTIAGVYLNRLKSGMKLQADPTVVFALGEYGIHRVLYEHLKVNSPYNTYVVNGLPPGPICMPSISSIQAVLDAEDHDYLFFCAKPGYDGTHAFASTLQAHNENAASYRKWLNKENIR